MTNPNDINIVYSAKSHYKQVNTLSKRRNVISAILRLVLLLIISSFLVFLLIDISPIDSLTANLGENATVGISQERIAELRDYWAKDVPLFERYFEWMYGVLHFDFGYSTTYRQEVGDVILERGSASIVLLAISWILSAIIGYFLGLCAGLKRNSAIDKVISAYCWIVTSTPTFWIALLAILVFSVNLKIFPVGFSQDLGNVGNATISEIIYHATLPCLVLTFTNTANYCLHTRQKTIEVKTSDYVKFERSLSTQKSVRPSFRNSIVKQHVLKNVNLPAISIAFSQIAEIVGGSIVIETVFSYPGLGNAIVSAAIKQDADLLAGITLIMCAIVFVGNTISNIISERRG